MYLLLVMVLKVNKTHEHRQETRVKEMKYKKGSSATVVEIIHRGGGSTTFAQTV